MSAKPALKPKPAISQSKILEMQPRIAAEPEMRDMLAALAPISLQDAIKHSALYEEGQEDMVTLENLTDRAAIMALLAMMRYEYADAMLEARKKVRA